MSKKKKLRSTLPLRSIDPHLFHVTVNLEGVSNSDRGQSVAEVVPWFPFSRGYKHSRNNVPRSLRGLSPHLMKQIKNFFCQSSDYFNGMGNGFSDNVYSRIGTASGHVPKSTYLLSNEEL